MKLNLIAQTSPIALDLGGKKYADGVLIYIHHTSIITGVIGTAVITDFTAVSKTAV